MRPIHHINQTMVVVFCLVGSIFILTGLLLVDLYNKPTRMVDMGGDGMSENEISLATDDPYAPEVSGVVGTLEQKPFQVLRFRSLAAASDAFSFTEIAQVTKLDVPYFKQQHTNSCEAASLRMALAYYGIEKTDIELITEFGYKPRLRDMAKNEWDDPQEMFVGYADTKDGVYGYGVYGKPVARTAISLGRNAEYRTDITQKYLAQEIRAGHPVIIWGNTSLNGDPYTWKTTQGKTVRAFKGEHARVVVGVRGPTDNPIGFYVHDPINGKSFEYWKANDLINQIYSVFGVTNQAVSIK